MNKQYMILVATFVTIMAALIYSVAFILAYAIVSEILKAEYHIIIAFFSGAITFTLFGVGLIEVFKFISNKTVESQIIGDTATSELKNFENRFYSHTENMKTLSIFYYWVLHCFSGILTFTISYNWLRTILAWDNGQIIVISIAAFIFTAIFEIIFRFLRLGLTIMNLKLEDPIFR